MGTVRLAFTSCMDADMYPEQPVWEAIAAQQPDALFLLGDQIYMDWNLTPKWKRIFVSEADGPKKFATEMHRRYALQWGVSGFRKLVAQVVRDKGAERILVAWDEHDMAWNNACGEALDGGGIDPESDRKHGVPKRARDIARLLFDQFVGVLRAGNASAPYPEITPDALVPVPPSAQRGVQQELSIDGIDTLLLDERFYRTARDHPHARLLGPGQLAWLKQKAAHGHGLLVVAGSSPLSHRYALSNQAWDDDELPYPDYRSFVNAVARPVLYVGGDVHRNAYSGLLPHTGIVQVLASGAARGDKWKAVPGSFVLADIDPGQRSVALKRHVFEAVEGTDVVHFDADGWRATEGGMDAAPEALPADPLPLFTLLLRRHHPDVPVNCTRAALDQVFRDRLPKPLAAEALELRSPGGSVGLRLDNGGVALRTLLSRAADQALQRHCQSLVLFVHAFNKPMSASIEQGLSLRQRYPGCEPVLFSWPSGDHAGLINFQTARSNADDGAEALADVLPMFTQAARDAGLPAVLFMRSLGARMLLSPAVAAATPGLQRVVLSAPAIAEPGHAAALDALACDAFVTLNLDDGTLKKAALFGRMLGNQRPDQALGQRALYIDCTDVDDAGINHDYFLDGGHGEHLQALHERLLYGAAVSLASPPPGFADGGKQLLAGA